ncbi:MAG: hypothetical protein LC798_05425 [Chloroflexi bacterium]|nr:hypothetical protein [Chloroflexota bacterium]
MAIVTTQGKEWVVDKMQSVEVRPLGGNGGTTGPGLMDRIWWGTGGSAEAITNTMATSTERTAEARVTGTLSQPTTTTDRCVGTITATGAATITETGRVNTTTVSQAGETLLMRALFTGVPVLTSDQVTFTLDVVAA